MTKRRLLRWSLLLVTLAAFAVWLEPTRVVWGWLRGEAFYQGRPTSYWRAKCDEWLDRFDNPDALSFYTWGIPFEIPGHPGLRMFGPPDDLMHKSFSIRMPRETLYKRLTDRFRSADAIKLEENRKFAPRILWAAPETEAVLLELHRELEYRGLATVALQRVARYRQVEESLSREGESAPAPPTPGSALRPQGGASD